MTLRATTAALALLLGALCACRTESERNELHGIREMRSGESIRSASIQRAIVAQRTLYSYHFVPGSAELNELGRRDLAVLGGHMNVAGGEIILARGDASDELQRAREESAVAFLREVGVSEERARLAEGQPGGDGISGARLVKILAKPSGPIGAAPTAGRGGGGGGASGGGGQQ